ncbi:MAG: dienelactone hydrolase family protein [Syntrophales bacterium]|jgi:putative phosphoribosyl transferase
MAKMRDKEVVIQAGNVRLAGIFSLPVKPAGVIVFAHGSGSGRLSPRNAFVAGVLQEAGFATLLFDLLEESEEMDRRKVFDIALLAERLLAGARWLQEGAESHGLKIGYFGASTGAAAALEAAAREPKGIAAIVSRGCRPALDMDYLAKVKTPTLLIVGGNDRPVIAVNRKAFENLKCKKDMVIIPGATHLFEEPGAIDEVARLAAAWFLKHMGPKK